MFQNRTKLFIVSALWLTCICIVLGLKTGEDKIGVTNAIEAYKKNNAAFAGSALHLKTAVSLLTDKDTAAVLNARLALKKSRLDYKKIEFFLDYFFESSSLVYNRPAKVEVDEPYMEYQEPSGFQVIEAMLFDDAPFLHKKELIEQAELLSSSAADLDAFLYGFQGTDQELLESVRLELIKVTTLSITGYDAPELKTGIEESYQSLAAVQQVLRPYLEYASSLRSTANTPEVSAAGSALTAGQTEGMLPQTGGGQQAKNIAAQLNKTLQETLVFLKGHPDFDSFNRMGFLTAYALPLQGQLGKFISLLNLSINKKSNLNYSAEHIFSKDAVPAAAFTGINKAQPLKAALGKKLFFENALSGNMRRNCSSCHRTDKYFSDGMKTSLAFDGKNFVQRNAPSLLYAGFQYAQFWDGRVKSLPEQIKAVIANPLEMNGNHAVVMANLQKNTAYKQQFLKAFPASAADPVNMENLADALSAFIMELAPMNSAFDQYIAGNKKAMSEEQLSGFNLFMGKGQCGSCHFAPLFNGLIPPLYKRTEYEVLGTPANDDFAHLLSDKDTGRYGFFPIEYYQAAFKTPSVRNAAMTAPYMHNGVFKDLNKVVEFYNQGGGAGLHMHQPQQTLSAKALHLSDSEVRQIVAFMESLTDRI
jgi:cytochrome c peroxidase